MIKKVIKLFKNIFGFSKRLSARIQDNVDSEDLKKVLSVTKQIIIGVRLGLEATDRNPQVDSKIENALKVASLRLSLIDGNKVNSIGDLIADSIKTIRGYPKEAQSTMVFMLAKSTAKHLFPHAKESHLDVLISGMIVVMKK